MTDNQTDSMPEVLPVDPEKIDVAQADPEVHVNVFIQAFKERDPGLIREWAFHLVETREFWIDVGLIALSLFVAAIASHLFMRAFAAGKLPTLVGLGRKFSPRQKLNPFRITLALICWTVLFAANAKGFHAPFLRAFALIVTLFVLIHLPSKFIEWKSWMRALSSLLFVLATLHVIGKLDDVIAFLDSIPIELGTVKLTVFAIIKGILTFALLLWLAGVISRMISSKIETVNDLSPNVKVLLRKGTRVALYVGAILVALSVTGVKLTALAVFGGALGLGIGFGLQKVVSNLVSGIILLLDKSVKPGDVIEIGDTYGWINSLNMRYASVITRDNKEHLIPNEDLITNPVVNWSYSTNLVRVKAPFGISYQSDLRKAMQLAEESAATSERVVKYPAPRCNLMGFGDSSIDLELRFSIEDPHNGVGRIRSQILLEMWDRFAEHGIDFPFPQRDVNLRVLDRDMMEKLVNAIQKSDEPNE